MYSYNTLSEISKALDALLSTKDPLDIKFVYSCKKIKRQIQEELSIIEESFPETPEKYEEYRQKLFYLYVENGAVTKQLPNGMQAIESTKDVDMKEVLPKIKKLNEEYKEVLQEYLEVENKKKEMMNEKLSSFTINKIPLSVFPSQIDPSNFPEVMLDIIED
jgi:hypothetical protein